MILSNKSLILIIALISCDNCKKEAGIASENIEKLKEQTQDNEVAYITIQYKKDQSTLRAKIINQH